MSTPLDLDAIKERIQDGKAISVPEVAAAEMLALISEVEALRYDIEAWTLEVTKLRAKLKKAKEALCWSLERLVDCKNCCGYGGVTIEAIKERQQALAELEKPEVKCEPIIARRGCSHDELGGEFGISPP